MADLFIALTLPASAGALVWRVAGLFAPRRAANDDAPPRVVLPHPRLLASAPSHTDASR